MTAQVDGQFRNFEEAIQYIDSVFTWLQLISFSCKLISFFISRVTYMGLNS